MLFHVFVNYSLLTIHYSFFCHSFQRLLRPPASGYRNRETGALGGIGVEGSSWSSSSNYAGSLNAGRLIFKSDLVNPLNNTNRANGLSVRCVQHLRLPLYQSER
ncbi:hypothetical protein [uncultured Alistipes sp.]|uniref:hypothetical protein n=1 Tax=uncultured Alistipes sp. TaxID=538949 RepID=UPI0025B2340F|nr:hypothetical protein [uncultured Alistipes sp.]